MSNLRNIMWQVRAAWAFAASVFKREWTIEDYPIRVWFKPVPESLYNPRTRPFPWMASVINWPGLAGAGNSKQEALEELRKHFERSKNATSKLPRPGTKVPIEFADSSRVNEHSELAKDFIERILGLSWAWISDESSLWDFHGNETNQDLIATIRLIYGVDVSDISSGNLADIFERISTHRVVPPTSAKS